MRRRGRKKKRSNNLIIGIVSISMILILVLSVVKIIDININTRKQSQANMEQELNNNIENNNNEDNKEQEAIKKSEYLSLEDDINAEDAKEVENRLNTWNYIREDGKKVAYLTFDDGPSEYVTDSILDVLKENDVKATFFVLGSMVEKSENAKNHLKRMVQEGHAIGNHGYCHRYEVLYPQGIADVGAYMDDIMKSEKVMKSVLGDDFHTRVLRFPGGHCSWDTNAIDIVLEEQGYTYIDWNVINGDAEAHDLSPDQLLSKLKETIDNLGGNDDSIVILMHDMDSKETTAAYLQQAITYLRQLGYEFKTLK